MKLSPIDYYFYQNSKFPIDFEFSFSSRLHLDLIYQASEKIIRQYPFFTSRIQTRGADLCLIPSYKPITIFENSLLKSVSNEIDAPLISITILSPKKLGISFSHLLGDGYSFDLFMRILSATIRTNEVPFFDINFDRQTFTTSPSNPLSDHMLFDKTGYSTATNNKNTSLLQSTNEFTEIKSNTRLMAELIKKYYCQLPLFQGSYIVRCPIDMRTKVGGLTINYFGNAFIDSVTRFSNEELKNLSIDEISEKIKKQNSSMTQEKYIEFQQYLELYRLKNGNQSLNKLHCPGLIISNMSRMFNDLKFADYNQFIFQPQINFPNLAVILLDDNQFRVQLTQGGSTKLKTIKTQPSCHDTNKSAHPQ